MTVQDRPRNWSLDGNLDVIFRRLQNCDLPVLSNHKQTDRYNISNCFLFTDKLTSQGAHTFKENQTLQFPQVVVLRTEKSGYEEKGCS